VLVLVLVLVQSCVDWTLPPAACSGMYTPWCYRCTIECMMVVLVLFH
jgi:hypothetical protein